MPDATDPMASIGYLIAAGAATVVGLVGYALALIQWTREARARNDRLQSERSDTTTGGASKRPGG